MTRAARNQLEHGVSKFKQVPPGERFQARYWRRERHRAGVTARLLWLALGLLALSAGVVMLAIPGPGLLVMLIGASLIAQESLTAARMLDRLDLWVRPLAASTSAWWQASSHATRLLLLLSALALVGAVGFGSYVVLLKV